MNLPSNLVHCSRVWQIIDEAAATTQFINTDSKDKDSPGINKTDNPRNRTGKIKKDHRRLFLFAVAGILLPIPLFLPGT